uniref:AAA family ATPase n=1 Tax=Agathobacter sp. TaxID=2021311 RepID=UPI0040566821
MQKKVAIGIQNFGDLIQKNCLYIDKTHFIKEWWESNDSVTLIARPRRFGKTLNMSMLEQFFSANHAGLGEVFEGLSIWEDEAYRKLQGSYPVISVSFANIKETTYEMTKIKMEMILRNLYMDYEFLLEADALSESEKKLMKDMIASMNETEMTMALYQLSKFLYRYYGRKAIILLDEYDTPMQEAFVNGYWDEMASFIRNLFNSTFKANPYLERAVMTGITRVSKESVFSDLNNLEVITTTSDKYETAFGFTEKEVFAALEAYGLESEKEQVKYWYDGFIFGNHTDIYNPWSILNFLDKGKYGTYWANTSSNSLVSKLIREAEPEVKITFEALLHGKAIESEIDEQIVYNRVGANQASIWSLLLASGYLKVLGYEEMLFVPIGRMPKYRLTLTNREVVHMFYGMVQSWFMDREASYHGFIKALLRNNLEEMNIYMNRFTSRTFSYFDVSENSPNESERFYHGFVLGLIAQLAGEYVVTSNRESGFGRYDIMMEAEDKTKPSYIFEFKVHNPRKEASMEETVDKALQQIEEKQYEAALVQRGIAKENIYKYGFAFEGKHVLIG